MKSLIALLFALTLSACATLPNPVTHSRIDALNASWGAALSLADGYADSCRQRLLPSSCRTVVLKMQGVARPIQGAVIRAREFARNPSISSTDLIRVASDAVNDFKVLQLELGVK